MKLQAVIDSLHASMKLQAVIDSLGARFPAMEIVDALGIFDSRNLQDASSARFATYGVRDLNALYKYFEDWQHDKEDEDIPIPGLLKASTESDCIWTESLLVHF